MDECTHLIAIDFGTAGCGIAFATSDKPQDITVYTEWPGHVDKIPAVLLVNPEGECEAFGKTALQLYNNYANTQHIGFDNYYLFRFFKMELYDQVQLLYVLIRMYLSIVSLCGDSRGFDHVLSLNSPLLHVAAFLG